MIGLIGYRGLPFVLFCFFFFAINTLLFCQSGFDYEFEPMVGKIVFLDLDFHRKSGQELVSERLEFKLVSEFLRLDTIWMGIIWADRKKVLYSYDFSIYSNYMRKKYKKLLPFIILMAMILYHIGSQKLNPAPKSESVL